MQRKEGPAVTATMTWVGLDVHARSTHGAAIDRESGELTRTRFGAGAEPVVAWLQGLPQPVYACYEAGTDRVCALPRRRSGGAARRRRRSLEDAARGCRPGQDRPQGCRAA